MYHVVPQTSRQMGRLLLKQNLKETYIFNGAPNYNRSPGITWTFYPSRSAGFVRLTYSWAVPRAVFREGVSPAFFRFCPWLEKKKNKSGATKKSGSCFNPKIRLLPFPRVVFFLTVIVTLTATPQKPVFSVSLLGRSCRDRDVFAVCEPGKKNSKQPRHRFIYCSLSR